MAVPREVRFSRPINPLAGITPQRPHIDPKGLFFPLANLPRGDLSTKNPGGLAGRTGVMQGSNGESEQAGAYHIVEALSC